MRPNTHITYDNTIGDVSRRSAASSTCKSAVDRGFRYTALAVKDPSSPTSTIPERSSSLAMIAQSALNIAMNPNSEETHDTQTERHIASCSPCGSVNRTPDYSPADGIYGFQLMAHKDPQGAPPPTVITSSPGTANAQTSRALPSDISDQVAGRSPNRSGSVACHRCSRSNKGSKQCVFTRLPKQGTRGKMKCDSCIKRHWKCTGGSPSESSFTPPMTGM